MNSGIDQLSHLKEKHRRAGHARLGPVAGPGPAAAVSSRLSSRAWRGWVPFGNGTVGDWVCHVVDPVFWALDLGAAATILAQVKDKDYDFQKQRDAFPRARRSPTNSRPRASAGRSRCTGTAARRRSRGRRSLEPGRKCVETGAVVLGDKGAIMYGSHGAGGVRIIPEAKMKAYKLPQKKHSPGQDHHQRLAGGHPQRRQGRLRFLLRRAADRNPLAGRDRHQDGRHEAGLGRPRTCASAIARRPTEFLNPPYRAGWTL